MPRKATGTKRWSKQRGVYVGRVPDPSSPTGKSDWLSLGTNDETVAKQRLAAWAAGGEPPADEVGKETFRAAAERILETQKHQKGHGSRRHRLRALALPMIGHIEVRALKPGNVHGVLLSATATRDNLTAECRRRGASVVAAERGLDLPTLERWVRVAEKGESRPFLFDTVNHLRSDISAILSQLVKEDELTTNVALAAELPEALAIDERERMVLTDEQYVAFQKRGFDGEVEMMALLSRNYAGGRPSDWWAWRRSDINTDTWMAFVRRPKTTEGGKVKQRRRRRRRATLVYERVEIRVPPECRAPLRAWLDKYAGLSEYVFPVTKGPRLGQKKRPSFSLAKAFRQAVWDEGIHDWMSDKPGFAEAVGDDRKAFDRLQVDTETTRALDFYSNRRAFVGALARAGVNLQQAMLMTGHSSGEAHQGYQPKQQLEVPAAVNPGAGALAPAPGASGGPRPMWSPECSEKQGLPQAPVSLPSPPPPDAVLQLAAALAALLGGQGLGGNGPGVGPNAPSSLVRTGFQSAEIIERAHLGSNQGPLAPEATSEHPLSRVLARLDALEQRGAEGHAGAMDQDLVHSKSAPSPVIDMAAARVRRRRRR